MSNSVSASAAQSAESALQDRASRLADREVIVCLSHMVSTLSACWGVDHVNPDMDALHQQAQELCYSITDFEEAARQAGFVQSDADHGSIGKPDDLDAGNIDATYGSWEEACEGEGLDAYEWEVFEHWAVSSWLAEKLKAAGERVDTDFAGLNVWARTTTGQAVSMDGVIRRIAADLHSA